jgi:glycosyltransferase involved in cell wall biosynthesis
MNYRKKMEEKAPHVGIFVSTLNIGGAEKVAITLANEFTELGVNVDLIVMSSSGALREQISPKVRVIDLGTNRGRRSLYALVAYIQNQQPEVVISLMTVPNLLLGLSKMFVRSKSPLLVGSEHSTYSDIYEREKRNFLVFLAYSIAARIGYRLLDMNIAVSEGVKQRMIHRKLVSPRKVKVISNPIEMKKIEKPTGTTLGLRPTIQLLAVGRLNFLKDYDTMLRAVDIIRKEHKVELNILGDGEERERLIALIEELDLQKNVNLIGNVLDTSKWYREADLLVLSSISEGFANVIVEALAHGVPVVSTDCLSGPREILNKSSYGSLVPVGNFTLLAEKIISLRGKSFDRTTLRLRAEDFDSRSISAEYLKVLLPS